MMSLTRSPVRKSGNSGISCTENNMNKEKDNPDQSGKENTQGDVYGQADDGSQSVRFEGRKAASFAGDIDLLTKEISKMADTMLPNTKLELRKSIEKSMEIIRRIKKEGEEVLIIDKEEWSSRKKNKVQKESTISELPAGFQITQAKMEEVNSLLNKRWEESVFKKVKVVTGDPAGGGEGGNSAFFFGNDPGNNQPLFNIVKKIHPSVQDMWKEREEKESFQILETLSRVRGQNPKMSLCFLAKGNSSENFVEKLTSIKRELEKVEKALHKNVIRIAAAKLVDADTLRKAAELVFLESTTEVSFMVPQKSKGGLGSGAPRGGRGQDSGNVNGIVKINSESMSYSDIAKLVKDNVNIGELGVEVKNIRKGNGDNLVILTKDKLGGEKLKQEIINKIGKNGATLKVESGGSRIAVMISQIESTVGREEIENEVNKILGVSGQNQVEAQKEVSVKVFESRNGTQTAEVWLEKNMGHKLIAAEKIKLGWSICNVRAKVKITRCYACLKMGHSFFECRNPIRDKKEKTCFNCTETGHFAAECQKPAWCNVCKQAGHRPDSADCPRFRHILHAKK